MSGPTIRVFFQRLGLGAGVGLICSVAYRSIQHLVLARATFRHGCWTWNRVPFDVAWIWPYASMFVLVGLPWFFLPNLSQVKSFAACVLGVAATGWIVFLVHPTAVVRPEASGLPFYYGLLLDLDGADNCLPCLHSAFSVLAALVLARHCRAFESVTARVFLGVWTAVICIAIVVLRQHTDLDTLAGVVLGIAGAWMFSRRQLS